MRCIHKSEDCIFLMVAIVPPALSLHLFDCALNCPLCMTSSALVMFLDSIFLLKRVLILAVDQNHL